MPSILKCLGSYVEWRSDHDPGHYPNPNPNHKVSFHEIGKSCFDCLVSRSASQNRLRLLSSSIVLDVAAEEHGQ